MLSTSRPTPARTPRPARSLLAALAVSAAGACTVLAAAPAGAVPVAPAAQVAPVAQVVGAPSPEEVEQARRAAEASRAQADAAQAQLSGAQAQLDALAAAASVALERYQVAVEARQAAEGEEAAQRERLAQAEATLAEGKVDLGQWASQAYRGGGTLQQYSSLVTVLQDGATDEAASALASVKRIGEGRSNAVNQYLEAQRVQADATQRAAAAAEEARVQAAEATAARQEADALVAQQREQVAQFAVLQQEATGVALSDAERAANLARAREEALAAEAAAAAAARAAGAGASGVTSFSGGITGEVGECAGANTAGYANGMIPRSALCPIVAAPGHVLRADAANAFNQLSQAYAEAFGSYISVTDSYRTLAGQIDVAARKPGLAARPGTSRHGLGIAVDLGAGIQNAGSEQHAWMKRNAALYGWINPAWAQNRGGQFEPWHWEYTG
ncbi:D-alanyl-D-alanine carboxypeptidase family protein [Kineococcus terrestris]|uniref:D-alanyl-D-alanine carboxypeptidase family protein n=1 Tax=Kineococcus terrestris TaxID=2044856 RepID=UPI0034DB2091